MQPPVQERIADSPREWNEIDKLLKLFLDSQNQDTCSDFFIEVLDVLFSDQTSVPVKLNALNLLTKMLGHSSNSSFFQFDLLKSLQVIERLFSTISFAREGIEEVFEIVLLILDVISHYQEIRFPKVFEIERNNQFQRKIARKTPEEVVQEDRFQYKYQLITVVKALIKENQEKTGIWNKKIQQVIHTYLLSIQQLVNASTSDLQLKEMNNPQTIMYEFNSILQEIQNPYSPIRSMGLSHFERLIKTRSEGFSFFSFFY